MWLTPGRSSGVKKCAPKLFMRVELNRGHCTTRSTVVAAPPAMGKDKNGGQTAVGLDPIYDGVQPVVLQRGLAVVAEESHKREGYYMECEQYGTSIW